MSNQPTILEDFTRAIIPIAIVGAAIAGLVIWGKPPKSETAAPPAPPAVTVNTTEATTFADPIQIAVDGVAQPHRHISIASEVSGRVKYKNPNFNDGRYIAAGEVLYEIDASDYESALNRIKQELLQAENSLTEWKVDRENAEQQVSLAEQDLTFARNEAARVRSLRASNAASEQEMEQSLRSEVAGQLAVQNLKNQIKALDARKARAEAALELQKLALQQAERNLARTKIIAPVDCVVVTDDCEEGGYVQSGKVVAIINDVNTAEVGCQLELSDLFWLWKARAPEEIVGGSLQPGKVYDVPPIPVIVEFPFHDRLCRWQGTVSRFGGTGMDLSTRTIPCRVTVSNPLKSEVFTMDGQPASDIVPPPLATGMFVSVRISVDPKEALVTVPANAVRSGGSCWLMRDGKLKIQPVKIARRMKDRVLLHVEAEGIQPGDKVVTSPLAVAEDGMALQEQVTKESTSASKP
jgi:multidrug efflux pump subunit AcrA (membrane-fusion protein)